MTWTSDTSDGSDREVGDEDEDLLGDVRDGAWLDSQDFPPLRWAVPGLLPEGFTLLAGPPKAGKSWLLANLLLAVASGGVALGKVPTGPARRVLYLALEDGDQRMQDRCRIITEGGPIPVLFHYKTKVPPGKVVAVLEAWMRRYPDTALIVLDTLGKVMPESRHGESAYQRDYRIGGEIKRVAENNPGLAVVVAHHNRKAVSDDFVDTVSGTNGLAGSADSIIVLARKRKASNALLKVTGRDVREEEYALELIEGTRWVLDGDDLDEAARNAQQTVVIRAVSDKSAQIIDFIAGRPERRATAKEIRDQFGEVGKYLSRHVEAGRLVKPGRGTYAVP